MELGLNNKVALVAASSRGLGRAVAEELAIEGANLILCARDAGPLHETAEAIRGSTGVRVLSVAADVSLPGDVRRVVDSALSEILTASTSSSRTPVDHQPDGSSF